jgi:hypothetical protein
MFRGYAKCGCPIWDEGCCHDANCSNNARPKSCSAWQTLLLESQKKKMIDGKTSPKNTPKKKR